MEKPVVYIQTRNRQQAGMTLVEILVAMTIIVIVFAVVAPQIRAIQNSWASKRENVEVVQNGRVLIDHITFNLTQANRLTTVSDSSEITGYIEFGDNDGNTMRYEVGAGNYVQFGPVGNLSELAGPVSQLQFFCYDACNLDTPITDVNQIRSVKVQSTFTNSGALGRNRSFTAQAYLRTNALVASGGIPVVEDIPSSAFAFETIENVRFPALSRIDASHYLCVYSRYPQGAIGGTGWAVVLTVDTANWTISKGPAFQIDSILCEWANLIRIDSLNHLCVYSGSGNNGYAVILTVNPATWEITKGTAFEFEATYCKEPALSQVDATNYLCAYGLPHGSSSVRGGWSRVLTVDTFAKTVTGGPAFRFETDIIGVVVLSDVDSSHHLCAYSLDNQGWANVLTVDPVTRVITKGTAYEFEPVGCQWSSVCKIDQNHYLNTYRRNDWTGRAIVITLDTGTWTIGNGPVIQWGVWGVGAEAQLISGGDVVVTTKDMFLAMRVDMSADTVTAGPTHDYSPMMGSYGRPTSVKMDDKHFFCVYEGSDSNGWAVILKIEAAGGVLP